jgi:hypothetical protein
MTRVLLADGLVVTTEEKSATPPQWMAVEFSQPVCMIGAEVVSIIGAVLAVVRRPEEDPPQPQETCILQVQGSNDLTQWDTIVGKTLPTTPQPFAYSDIRVGYRFVRLRYHIALTSWASSTNRPSWTLSVELETGLRGTTVDA